MFQAVGLTACFQFKPVPVEPPEEMAANWDEDLPIFTFAVCLNGPVGYRLRSGLSSLLFSHDRKELKPLFRLLHQSGGSRFPFCISSFLSS